ncbi:MAG: allophanate hydrolase [Pseudorhodobacter sp.]|nr:allophanate hydrolase [Rhizobacter sp.]
MPSASVPISPVPEGQPLTLTDWRSAYGAGASPAHLLGALRQRLHGAASEHAWIALIDAHALSAAAAALEARAAAHPERAAALRAMPLFGVPFAAKDNIDVIGFPTTAACPAFAHEVDANATVIARLQQAGAVCMGKTNLDQFATGLVGARSPYGRPSSAFSSAHISGGSSSGSAVVVAAGEVCFALGTDTAGSGRVPAGFNNIVGMKPTPGRVSNAGVLPACRTLDCVAVLALTVSDAAEVMAVIEGADPLDAYSAFQTGPSHLPTKLRIGVPSVPVLGNAQGADPLGYAAAFAQAVSQAEVMGHTVVPLDFEPLHAVANLLYSGPWVAERHAVVQPLMDSHPGALDPTVALVIGRATSFTATDTFRAQYLLKAAQRDTAALWHHVDVLMVPTAPTHPTHAEVDADPVAVNAHMGTYTNFVNLLGWCALALPGGWAAGLAAGLDTPGLPFGVTFIAPGASDAALARFGLTWESHLNGPLGASGRAGTGSALSTSNHATSNHATSSHATDNQAWPASEPRMAIAVVGAHLSGMPLNGQLTQRGARFLAATHTSPHYQLFALPNTTPPKPGLQRTAVDAQGESIAVEVWDMPVRAVGSFLALIPPPLGLGSVELIDGRWVHGFICEAHALSGAREVTSFGGWRAYLKSLA